MTVQSIAEILLAVAALALIVARQVRWRAFDPARAMRVPVVLAAIGLLNLVNGHGGALTSTDVALLGAELVLSVGVGAAMGRMTAFRRSAEGVLQSRTGWAGASLWLVLIAVRIGMDVAGAALGSHVVTTTGVILLLIAASRATSALVARARAPRPASQVGMIVR